MSKAASPISRRERRARARLEPGARPRSVRTRRAPRRIGLTGLALTSIAAMALGLVAIVFAGGLKPGGTAELAMPSTSYAGVAGAAFRTCIQRGDVRQPIRAGTAAAARAGIVSTPTLVINGTSMVGVPNYDQLRSLIEQLGAPTGSPRASSTAP